MHGKAFMSMELEVVNFCLKSYNQQSSSKHS